MNFILGILLSFLLFYMCYANNHAIIGFTVSSFMVGLEFYGLRGSK